MFTDVSPLLKLTLTESGLILSWSLLSSQVFLTVTLVVSGMCVLVIVNVSSLYVVVYSFTGFSVTVYVITFPASLYVGNCANV